MRNKIIRRDKGDGNDSASESFRKSKRALYLFFPFTAAFVQNLRLSLDPLDLFFVQWFQRWVLLAGFQQKTENNAAFHERKSPLKD